MLTQPTGQRLFLWHVLALQVHGRPGIWLGLRVNFIFSGLGAPDIRLLLSERAFVRLHASLGEGYCHDCYDQNQTSYRVVPGS